MNERMERWLDERKGIDEGFRSGWCRRREAIEMETVEERLDHVFSAGIDMEENMDRGSLLRRRDESDQILFVLENVARAIELVRALERLIERRAKLDSRTGESAFEILGVFFLGRK